MDLFLTIMLTILVVIGYVLGAIVLLVLLLLAVMLFVPIRYQLYMEHRDQLLGYVRVSWLFSAIIYELTYTAHSGGGPTQQIRLLGRLWGRKPSKTNKRRRKQKSSAAPSPETPTETTQALPAENPIPLPSVDTLSETHPPIANIERNLTEHDSLTEPLTPPKASPESPAQKAKSDSQLSQKLRAQYRQARQTYKNITAQTKKYQRALKRLYRLPRKQRILRLLRRFLKKLTRRLKPDYFNLEAEVGLGAYNTGRLMAALALFLTDFSPKIVGNFETNTLQGKLSVGGRLQLSHVALPMLGLYFKKDIRNAIRYLIAVIKPLL